MPQVTKSFTKHAISSLNHIEGNQVKDKEFALQYSTITIHAQQQQCKSSV